MMNIPVICSLIIQGTFYASVLTEGFPITQSEGREYSGTRKLIKLKSS